jgi:chemotaxis-related protein WspB
MRAFVFQAAGAHFAMDASCIQAVHPLVLARPVPASPDWLTGVIDVHGELVPLIDACALLGHGHVSRTIGARVLLVDTGSAADEVRARFALAVDRVMDPAELDLDGSWRGGGSVSWLGAVVQHEGVAAQVFDPMALAQVHRELTAPPVGELPSQPEAARSGLPYRRTP